MGFFFGRKTKHIPKNATWRLTQEGRDKLQEFSGDEKSQILVALETGGSLDAEEISRSSGLSRGQVERFALILARKGQIQLVSSATMS